MGSIRGQYKDAVMIDDDSGWRTEMYRPDKHEHAPGAPLKGSPLCSRCRKKAQDRLQTGFYPHPQDTAIALMLLPHEHHACIETMEIHQDMKYSHEYGCWEDHDGRWWRWCGGLARDGMGICDVHFALFILGRELRG